MSEVINLVSRIGSGRIREVSRIVTETEMNSGTVNGLSDKSRFCQGVTYYSEITEEVTEKSLIELREVV